MPRHHSARRSRSYRPAASLLEERCLLSVTLSETAPSPLVGSPVTWTASANDLGPTPVYQFLVGPVGGALQVVRDFNTQNTFTWDPLQQGTYTVAVVAKDSDVSPASESAFASYSVDSRVSGSTPVVSPTSNPLVALFSVPPSPGQTLTVEFRPAGSNQLWASTTPQPIVPGESTNVIVAGMVPNSTYEIRDVLDNGTTSAPVLFTTGSLPGNLKFPTFTVQQAPLPGVTAGEHLVFHIGISPPSGTVDTVATTLSGKIAWYYDPVAHHFPGFATEVVQGGTVLMLGGKTDNVAGASTLREINLIGDTLRETNVDAVNAQLAAMGQPQITVFTHDAQRLPNGDTAVLALTTQTVDIKGKPVNYTGDMVLVLNPNFQVNWVWNPFQWLNVHRLPTLGEGPADWMHANSITYSPEDGDLVVSLRSQDWVIKINYANGTGNGAVLWKLGHGGNFPIISTSPLPWFSHQHDVRYINANTLLVFDDGNTRHSTHPYANSRGQELILNEKTMQATLVVNANLGSYAPALGSSQMLPNGNLVFGQGFTEQTIEVQPNGRKVYIQKMTMPGKEYRSYLLPSLYVNPSPLDLPSTPVTGKLARLQLRAERRVELRLARMARIAARRALHAVNIGQPGPIAPTTPPVVPTPVLIGPLVRRHR